MQADDLLMVIGTVGDWMVVILLYVIGVWGSLVVIEKWFPVFCQIVSKKRKWLGMKLDSRTIIILLFGSFRRTLEWLNVHKGAAPDKENSDRGLGYCQLFSAQFLFQSGHHDHKSQ